MKKDRSIIKHQYERFVGDTLLDIVGKKIVFIRHGNDKDEPDLIYKSNNILGIEIGTVYTTPKIATSKWTLASGERKFSIKGFEIYETIFEPDQQTFRNLIKEIGKKCYKSINNYKFKYPYWLCIYMDPMCFVQKKDIINAIKNVQIPNNNFVKIYILNRNSKEMPNKYELVEIHGT